MIQLLSSFWFIALAALLVPVLIHFWNKKQPRVIKFGSIKWLAASASKKASSLCFQDWPLLLLRCLLLAALVMFLVQPIWKQKLPFQNLKYAWVAPELLQEKHLPLIQSTFDSLIKQQYQLRQLTHDFAPITPEAWINIKQGQSVIKSPTGTANYWGLVKSLNQKFNNAAEHLIFTPNQLTNFTGKRPVLNPNIKWVIIPVAQQKTWVQEAFFSGSDSVIVLLGHSAGSGINFSRHNFATPTTTQTLTIAGAPELVFSREDAQAYVNITATREKVLVKADPLHLVVFYDRSRTTDATYVRAALTALRTYTRRPVSIKVTDNINNITPKPDRLFWLSDERIPEKLTNEIAQGLFVFKDAPNLSKNAPATWFTVAGLPEPVLLSKQAPVARENSFQKWQNNYGESVLHFVPEGKGGTYYFASRFNTQWNSLPESSFFPEIFSSLLWQEPVIKQDVRAMTESQIRPVLTASTAVKSSVTFQILDLKYWFLLLATLLFSAERVWVFQKAKLST